MRLILCLIPRMDSWMLMPVDANFWNPSDSSKRPYHYHYHYQIIKYQIINHKSYPKKKRKAQNSRGSWWRGQVWVTGHYFISRSEWVSEGRNPVRTQDRSASLQLLNFERTSLKVLASWTRMGELLMGERQCQMSVNFQLASFNYQSQSVSIN